MQRAFSHCKFHAIIENEENISLETHENSRASMQGNRCALLRWTDGKIGVLNNSSFMLLTWFLLLFKWTLQFS